MPDTDTIQDAPQVDQDKDQTPPPQPGPGPQQPTLKDEDKQRLVKIIQNMQKGGESDDNIRAVVKRFQEINGAPTPSTTPVDKGIRETTKSLNEPIQFNGTFTPDLEGEKKGLYLNDPDYQKQKNDFVQRIATDPKGNLLYPEKDDKTGQWSNYYTKQPLPGFDPSQIKGAILQVPHEYLPATGGKQFITPQYDPQSNAYNFPGVQTPDVPTEQTLPDATVYGKTKGAQSNQNFSGAAKVMVDESKKQGGQLADVINNHPELSDQINQTLSKYGPEYVKSLTTGSGAMSNVLQKTVEDHYDLNKPLPNTIDPQILDGHLNVVNNFEKNRQNFELNQRELQRQADLLTDRAKRTGQPVDQTDAGRLAQKASQNIQQWNTYAKSVQFSQNFLNQPDAKQYLDEFKKRQTGIQLMDEIKQRAFPDDVNDQGKQDEYDRKAIEGNLNAWDYVKTAAGKAGSALANIGTGAAMLQNPSGSAAIESLNNSAQKYLQANLPAISPEAIDQMNKEGIGHTINDVSSMVGGIAPYIIPGGAGEGLGAKAATFATALAEGIPDAKKEAENQGLTGSAYNTFIAAKPLVSAAFMTLLPNVKFAKGFDNDVAKAVVNGEFNNTKQALLNLAKKVVTVHPGDIAHIQAMLSGTSLGEALVNKITNGLQATQDLDRGISRKEGLPTELSGVFNPRQTAVMALTGKLLEAIPTLKKSIGNLKAGKDIQSTYDNIQNNLVELAGHNLEGASDQVNKLVKKDPGNIYAQHLKTTLEDFAHAEARMPQGLEPEQKAALFDVQKKIMEKQRQMATADPVYQPHLQKNIDELGKQIQDIFKDPKKANDYLASGHKEFAREIMNPTNADENDLEENRKKDLADLKERESGLNPKMAGFAEEKANIEKERDETNAYYDKRLSSPKTETNGKTENAPDAETEGRQEIEKPNEGAEPVTGESPAPSIEKNPAYRTLDYGNNKGKPEGKLASQMIKQEILEDAPVGKTGEKFSDFLGRVLPAFQKSLKDDEHNTAIVTHSSVIKALHVWEDMGRPDISELKGDKLKDFAQKYVDLEPEAEGKVHTFTGDNGDIKIVRHGETEDNKLSEFREDDTKLTDKGEAQAARAGDNLIKETGGDIPKIISSDLPRTLHTSEIINQKLKDHAIQIGRPEEVLQREQGEDAGTGSGRERVEPGQQGNEPAGESGQSGQPTEEKSKDADKKAKVDDLPFIEEEGDNEFTSTRNAIAKKKIEESGLKPAMEEAAREFGTVWKDAQEKLGKGFDIEKLIKSLDQKPRAVTDLENAMILFHQNVKESQLADANKDIADATDKDDRIELEDAIQRRAKILDDLQHIYNVDKKIGRETAVV
jgi:broad specificity phosphatase PhoE